MTFLGVVVVLQSGLLAGLWIRATPSLVPIPAIAARVEAQLIRLPLAFEPTAAGSSVDFVARGAGYGLALEPTMVRLALRGVDTPLALRFLAANETAAGAGEAMLPGTVNYFLGNDPARWRTGVPTFSAVRYREVYPGIDLRYYGTAAGELEHDLIVAPGADPTRIAFSVDGADTVTLGGDGDLVLRNPRGEVRLRRPITYQESAGGRQLIPSGYQRTGSQITYWVGAYDGDRALVIDPTLVYSTLIGGAGQDIARAVAIDSTGAAYVAGYTASTNFPTQSPIQGANAGGTFDAFVSKLNASGSALVYSTYLGGTGRDLARALAVDATGAVYVTGETDSASFPTVGAMQPALGGDSDGFVSKLNAAGSALLYSTFLGGAAGEDAVGIAVDSSGAAYVAGRTSSTNFPTVSPLQAANAGGVDAFVSKLNAAGSALVYSTYLGGAGTDFASVIAVDSSGAAYAAGETASTNFPTQGAYQNANAGFKDAFVSKLNAAGSALEFSTYLGGSDGEDTAMGIAIDGTGATYVVGQTSSSNFPTQGALQSTRSGFVDAFVSKLGAAGSTLAYSTYLGGGADDDAAYAVVVDAAGAAYVVGETSSTDFPTSRAIQNTNGGSTDAFVSKLNAAGSALAYSTYLGGSGTDLASAIALDAAGTAYVAGHATSTNFPTTAGAFQNNNAGGFEGFLAKVSSAPTLTSLSPSSGQRPSNIGVALNGTNFVTGATAVSVSGTGVTVTNVMVASSLSLAADFNIAADAAGGTRTVTVTTENGTSNGLPFTVTTFTDDPLVAGSTVVKAVHITELRVRVNAVRNARELGPFSFTDAPLSVGALIEAVHVVELRTALDQAYAAAKMTSPTYTDPGLATGTMIKAAHIQELRAAVIAIE
jgi:hypothetical protein